MASYRRHLSDRFYGVGNTAGAAYQKIVADFPTLSADVMKVLRNPELDYIELLYMRHPDIRYAGKWKITDPELQMRGSWNRIFYSDGPKPKSRDGYSSWIWKSHLYVFGGRCHRRRGLEDLNDLWSIPSLCCRYILTVF